MDLQQVLAANVRGLRLDAGLSQEELAHRARIHVTYLSGVENGQRNPSLKVIERIATALRVDPAHLLARSEVTT
jgi:transcriptional regulator with XRE-family HTH domain